MTRYSNNDCCCNILNNSWKCYLILYMHWQRLRRHGDILKRTVGGYLVVQGRADDTMNLGGIKVVNPSRLVLLSIDDLNKL